MNNLKYHLSVLIVFICFITCSTLSAQNLPANFNVEQASDEQIRSVLQQAQAQGLSDAQIMQRAQASGMSSAQIQRLQVRIEEVRRKGNSIASDTSGQSSFKRLEKQEPTSNIKDNSSNDLKPKIFGADLFRNNTSNPFESNLKIATPINYMVGPDDRLLISVFGNSVASWSPTVSPDGNISIPTIGVIKVAGKTIERVRADIRSKLIASNYAIGRGTELRVDLGDIRSIKVIIQGHVVQSGTFTVSSLATVMNALFLAGGPSDIGSFRKVQVIRNNRVIRSLDIYDFLVKDSQEGNIALRDQDIIRVPAYDMRVEIRGEVKIPALFEMIPGETVQDLINYSGGFTDQAYTARIKVDRISGQQHALTDIVEANYKTTAPLRGDKFIVEKILDRYENRVAINGAVFRPGPFELEKGLTLSQLIKKASGLREDAFTARGSITRLNPDNTIKQISFNVNDVLTNPGSDIVLQREDQVIISSIFDLRDEYTVTINGQVRNPGSYAYADSMKVADLIIKAGGFTEGATGDRIQVSRRIYNSDPNVRNSPISEVQIIDIDPSLKGNQSFTLKQFDIVSVYSSPGYGVQKTVVLEGEVLRPGPYTIKSKDEKISDIIARAGGLTAAADVEGSSLKRDNAAILGVDKTKVDTAELNRQRNEQLKILQNTYKEDGKKADSVIYRNNYIGIDLKKILKKPGSPIDLIVEDGDIIRVPKQQQIVKVNGEVLYPSGVVYQKGMSFKEYVLRAGGYSPKAYKRGAMVVYPNGTVKGTRKFLLFNIHPRVKPGSEIYVSQKPERKDNLQQILALTTSIASLGAIIFGVLSLNK